MKDIKLVVCDLDDTLLRDDKTISSYTKEIFNKLRERGIKTAFATARGESVDYIKEYKIFDAYITINGARLEVDGKFIYEKLISPEVYRPFLEEMSKRGIKLGAEINRDHLSNFDAKKKWPGISNNKMTDFSKPIEAYADKLYALPDNEEKKQFIFDHLPKDLHIKVARDGLVMIMEKDATKLKAIKALAEYYKISMDQVVSFGDDVNDLEMLQGTGLGVAMGNALDQVKEASDEVCGSNMEDGVASWLESKLI